MNVSKTKSYKTKMWGVLIGGPRPYLTCEGTIDGMLHVTRPSAALEAKGIIPVSNPKVVRVEVRVLAAGKPKPRPAKARARHAKAES